MARKKKPPEHVNHERWLVSYADFITLLFAFFVVMFASSQVDHRKVGKLARAVQMAFQELGVFAAMGHSVPLQEEGSIPDKIQLIESIHRTTKFSELVSVPGQFTNPDSSIGELKQRIETAIAEEGNRTAGDAPKPDTQIQLRIDHRGLIISLAETTFFDSGAAVVREESYSVLDTVARSLLTIPNHIRIEGHTDNQPIKTGRFPSNWELSIARATFISNYLLKKFNYPPQKLSIAGYGEYHPLASNGTTEGRALNRRVDIVVLNDKTLHQEEPPPTKG